MALAKTRIIIRSTIAQEANAATPDDQPRPFTSGHRWQGIVPVEGETDDERLESIFRSFNRVTLLDAEWLELVGYRLPSLSVRDQITLDAGTDVERTYEVGSVGFVEVER
jgi:hypothetical protein